MPFIHHLKRYTKCCSSPLFVCVLFLFYYPEQEQRFEDKMQSRTTKREKGRGSGVVNNSDIEMIKFVDLMILCRCRKRSRRKRAIVKGLANVSRKWYATIFWGEKINFHLTQCAKNATAKKTMLTHTNRIVVTTCFFCIDNYIVCYFVYGICLCV